MTDIVIIAMITATPGVIAAILGLIKRSARMANAAARIGILVLIFWFVLPLHVG